MTDAVEIWCSQRQAEGYSPYTLRSYRITMRLLVRDVGDLHLDEVTLDHLRGFITAHSTRLKASSTAHRVRMIKSLFTWAVEEDYLVRSPARKLKEPKLPARIPKFLSVEELELIREACRSLREHALIEMLFATGCRAAEVSGINRSDIDWHRKALIVLGKGQKEREVYFGARAAIWLRRYIDTRKDSCPALFVTEKGPVAYLRPRQVWWVVKKVAARAGMRTAVWPHKFRHTLATTLLNQGAKLDAVQSILGHEKPETTQIYARLSGVNRQQEYQRHFIQ